MLRRAAGLAARGGGRGPAPCPTWRPRRPAWPTTRSAGSRLAECRSQLGLPVEVPAMLGPSPTPRRREPMVGLPRPAGGGRGPAGRGPRLVSQGGGPEPAIGRGQPPARPGDPPGPASPGPPRRPAGRRAPDRGRDLRRTFTAVRSNGFEPDAALFSRLGEPCLDSRDDRRGPGLVRSRPSARPRLRPAALADAGRPRPTRSRRPLAARVGSPRRPGAGGPDRQGRRARPAPGSRTWPVAAGSSYQYDHGAGDDLYLADTMGGGVGLIDFDGDGRLDVYFVNGCPLPVDPERPPGPEPAVPEPRGRHVRRRDRGRRGRRPGLRDGLRRRRYRRRRVRRPVRHRVRLGRCSTGTTATGRSRT